MLETYARRVIEAAVDWRILDSAPRGKIASHEVAAMMMSMPHGAVAQTFRQTATDDLNIIGDHVGLQEHYNSNFVQAVNMPGKEFVQRMCLPYVIPAERLMHLNEWIDWKMLQAYLVKNRWGPVLTFKNTPVRVPGLDGPGYVCDIRIIPHDDIPIWLS